MKCYYCGASYRKNTDLLEVDDPYVGKIIVQGSLYYICSRCGDILYTAETAQLIDEYRQQIMNRIVRDFPLEEFLTTSETAKLLGITKQALNKNRRIARGFIYKTKIGNIDVYLKKSVEQFKTSGDGRFVLKKDKRQHQLTDEKVFALK